MTDAVTPGEAPLKQPMGVSILVAAALAAAAFAVTMLGAWLSIRSAPPAPVVAPVIVVGTAVPAPTASPLPPPKALNAAVRLEMIKIALTVSAGVGGLVALVVAYRRQRVTEGADRRQRQVDADAKHDATERRITELYTKAAQQLGNDKAPVRLAGLYALERLAQGNPAHRQTVIDVICAYLRMPYTPPNRDATARSAKLPPDIARARSAAARRVLRARHRPAGSVDPQEEQQVRLTAQQILTRHLTRPEDLSDEKAAALTATPDSDFWPGRSVDLTGAHLISGTFDRATLDGATFAWATFLEDASFYGATFVFPPKFDEAKFNCLANFREATFIDNAWFSEVTFNDDAFFEWATFGGDARFDGATFTGEAWFDGVTFTGTAWFDGATFTGPAPDFNGARVNNRTLGHSWPAGWTTEAERAHPGGTLVLLH